MTPQNTLDLKGIFRIHPFAELLVEIGQAALSGSLRLSHGDRKSIIYFRDGNVVYGVSNAREHRLLGIILELKKADTQRLARLPKSANDVEFAASLVKEGILPTNEISDLIGLQIERIIVAALSWPDGEFIFSPLVKPREDLVFIIDFHKVLIDYARCQPAANVAERFKSVQESFEAAPERELHASLHSHELFVLQRFRGGSMNLEQLKQECGLPENGLLAALYVLWLGGLLFRRGWNAAFSENRLAAIRNAKVSLVKQAQNTSVESNVDDSNAESIPEPAEESKTAELPVIEISLADYLERTEKAETHYDVMGVAPNATGADIKNAYFGLAKLFHPDRFHRDSTTTLAQIQGAFSSVAQAYETLKSNETRENYDFKIRKNLETREKLRAQGIVDTEKVDPKTEQGLENFEMGLSLLMDDEHERAVPFLGRAAHYNPDNALYRAYYGKALSYDENQRHKAEGEMQAAAKIDPKNPKIRLMLAEFFIDMNMLKRAEGELNRLLEITPNNVEARKLLNRIQN
ncbi:MAG: DnaJ domain-containing protein [Pyrinomonadaceae bacterium]